MKFIILIFILSIISVILKPSDDIWNKVLKYIDEGKMNNYYKQHFFFDEDDLTALNINDTRKMEDLYKKQKQIFFIYGISTYIFSVKYINESLEELGSIRNNTRDNLKKGGYYVDYSIFAIFSIESLSGKIYTGKYINNILINDSEALSIKENLISTLKNKSYYDAWNNFLDDIDDIISLKTLDILDNINNMNFTIIRQQNTSQSPSQYSPIHRSSGVNIMAILGPILGSGVVIGLFFLICKCCKNCKLDNGNTSVNSNIGYNDNYSNNNNASYGNNSYGNNSIGGHSYQANNSPSIGGNSLHSGGA